MEEVGAWTQGAFRLFGLGAGGAGQENKVASKQFMIRLVLLWRRIGFSAFHSWVVLSSSSLLGFDMMISK